MRTSSTASTMLDGPDAKRSNPQPHGQPSLTIDALLRVSDFKARNAAAKARFETQRAIPSQSRLIVLGADTHTHNFQHATSRTNAHSQPALASQPLLSTLSTTTARQQKHAHARTNTRRTEVCDRCYHDTEPDVAPRVTRGRNMRSRCRCSMCPAIHTN